MFTHLGHDVVLVLEDESPLSVIFVPVQLHDQRFLVQVQFPLFCQRDRMYRSEFDIMIRAKR